MFENLVVLSFFLWLVCIQRDFSSAPTLCNIERAVTDSSGVDYELFAECRLKQCFPNGFRSNSTTFTSIKIFLSSLFPEKIYFPLIQHNQTEIVLLWSVFIVFMVILDKTVGDHRNSQYYETYIPRVTVATSALATVRGIYGPLSKTILVHFRICTLVMISTYQILNKRARLNRTKKKLPL